MYLWFGCIPISQVKLTGKYIYSQNLVPKKTVSKEATLFSKLNFKRETVLSKQPSHKITYVLVFSQYTSRRQSIYWLGLVFKPIY